jgi:hypothetical protein
MPNLGVVRRPSSLRRTEVRLIPGGLYALTLGIYRNLLLYFIVSGAALARLQNVRLVPHALGALILVYFIVPSAASLRRTEVRLISRGLYALTLAIYRNLLPCDETI